MLISHPETNLYFGLVLKINARKFVCKSINIHPWTSSEGPVTSSARATQREKRSRGHESQPQAPPRGSARAAPDSLPRARPLSQHSWSRWTVNSTAAGGEWEKRTRTKRIEMTECAELAGKSLEENGRRLWEWVARRLIFSWGRNLYQLKQEQVGMIEGDDTVNLYNVYSWSYGQAHGALPKKERQKKERQTRNMACSIVV